MDGNAVAVVGMVVLAITAITISLRNTVVAEKAIKALGKFLDAA